MKLAISSNTSNNFIDCDKMFIPDFLYCNAMINKKNQEKQNELESMLYNLK